MTFLSNDCCTGLSKRNMQSALLNENQRWTGLRMICEVAEKWEQPNRQAFGLFLICQKHSRMFEIPNIEVHKLFRL
jgi:hypothetical protein